MLITKLFALFSSASLLTSALSLPESETSHQLEVREPRGGGGGRGGGGSIGGSSGSSSGSSGGSRSGSSSSGSSGSSGSTGSSGSRGTSSGSNVGGTSARGSGVTPSFGGRYAGGARTPYAAGGRSRGGIVPGLLIGGGLGFWLLAGGASWGRYGAYEYKYPADLTFYNQTSMMNETLPGTCLCRRYAGCSCEAPTGNSSQFVEALVGDGSYQYQQAHRETFQIVERNDRRTLAVNGTLANGTTAASGTSSAASGLQGLTEKSVWLVVAAAVGSAVCVL